MITAAGRWKGTYRLWEPSATPQRSRAVARIAPVIGDRFIRIDYAWSYDGDPQQGSLLVGYEDDACRVTAIWIDSWHMGGQFMISRGAIEQNGNIAVRGSYAVPSGPDWGWRTVIESRDGRPLRMLMYNMAPDGKEALAVEATFTKVRTTQAPPNKRLQPTKARARPARKRRPAARPRG